LKAATKVIEMVGWMDQRLDEMWKNTMGDHLVENSAENSELW
jgi:hypothetical protein